MDAMTIITYYAPVEGHTPVRTKHTSHCQPIIVDHSQKVIAEGQPIDDHC